MNETNELLLDRVKELDAHDAWKLFYDQYWAVILAYARKIGLKEHQAEEVLQETMVALMRILPGFRYDRAKGKFRNFLLTIVHRKSLAVLRRSKREATGLASWACNGAADKLGPGDGKAEIEEEVMARWRESIMEEALRRLRERSDLGDNTFAVFEAYVINKRAASAVAAEFGLKENAVYQIKNRMVRFLRHESERLQRGEATET
jgi:RNA polymerase sigma-70 factor (ECF subfamily)